ncbi:hypothetical protein MKW98_022830, partial [Papaver atlanticum]
MTDRNTKDAVDRKGKRKMQEVDIEPRIHWYPHEYCVDCFPYGIAFPQGCESPGFEESFPWYLDDLQHNVNVKVEECLDQDGPPSVVHELLIDSPVERLKQFLKQPNPAPINQDTSNPFEDQGEGVVPNKSILQEKNVESGPSHPPEEHQGNQDKMSDIGEIGSQSSTAKPRRPGSDDDSWVLYAYHPKYGPFQVHEGVVVVADRFLVSGLSRVGFQSITLAADERHMVRQLAARPWHYDEPMHFPVMDALCPATGLIGQAIFTGGVQPTTDPVPDPNYPTTVPTK